MKILITSKGGDLDSGFDLRFGRAGWFCIYDEETKETTFYQNENSEARGGAGSKSAEKAIELGAKMIVSGDFGPKAKDLLDRFEIQLVIMSNEDEPIRSLIEKINPN